MTVPKNRTIYIGKKKYMEGDEIPAALAAKFPKLFSNSETKQNTNKKETSYKKDNSNKKETSYNQEVSE